MSGPSPAERLLLGLGIDRPGDIDLEAIARSLGAVVKTRPMDGCEATIVGNGRKAVIAVNENSIEVRRRFSVAHEIGHWCLHRNRVLLCTAADIGNRRNGPLDPERQADDFAADLVLPEYLLRPMVARLARVRLDEVREIAAEFRASVTATLLKIAKSGRFPVVIVGDEKGAKARERWAIHSPLVPGWWKVRRDLDPETFAYHLLCRGADEEKWPRTIGADAWFEFRGCDRYEVKEQSFRVSDNSIVSIVTIPGSGLG